MSKLRGLRPSPAMVVATISLIVALSGIAWAQGKIRTQDIRARAVTSPKIASQAVKGGKIRSQAVKGGKIRPDAVKTQKIEDGAVTGDKVADGVLQPRAFAYIANNGTVIANRSEGITSANVTMAAANSIYCLSGLGFEPKIALATVDWIGGGNNDVRTTVIPPGVPSVCPAGTQASARTTNSGSGAAGTPNRIQIALFD